MGKQQPQQRTNKGNKGFERKTEDVDLIKQLLLSPDAFITERTSDEILDKHLLKIKLFSGREFTIDDYIAEEMVKYESKFFKDWFYRLADLYKVDRKLMDVYIKPDFVRRFIIQFVYGRFPYLLLRTLRSRNRKLRGNGGKLFQHLKTDASEKLDIIVGQVYEFLGVSKDPLDFKMRYSKEYRLYFQVELF
jgi:hypothetical protein